MRAFLTPRRLALVVAVLAIVVLSIWLRQDRSPQSKPVDAPHGNAVARRGGRAETIR